MSADSDMLTGLSVAELEALADGLMAPARQVRLEELLAKSRGRSLDDDERRELDRLLELADQLTVLKTRARYTLGHRKVESTGP